MKNLILSLTIVFFGNSIYKAQITTKPTRTYTKKVEQSTNNTPTTKPTRTYATKVVTTNNSSNSVKPSRTYATKPENKSNSNTPPIPKITENKPAKTEKVEPQTTAPKKESSGSWFSKIFGNSKKSNTKAQTTNETYKGHQVLIGPKGGKYYINKNGNKTYIK